MNLDRGRRPPPRHPLGRTCGGKLLAFPLWPLFIAVYHLRRHRKTSAALRAPGTVRVERAEDAATPGSGGRTSRVGAHARPDPRHTTTTK